MCPPSHPPGRNSNGRSNNESGEVNASNQAPPMNVAAGVHIQRLACDNQAHVKGSLDALRVMVCIQDGPVLVIARDGVPAIVAAIQRFPGNAQVFLSATAVLTNLATHVHGPTLAKRNAAIMVNAGVLEVCIESIHREESDAEVLDACCMLLSNIASAGRVSGCGKFASRAQREAVTRAAIDAMRRYPDDTVLQANAQGLLLALTNDPPEETVRPVVLEHGGIDTVIASMRNHAVDAGVQASGIGALCHCSYSEEVGVAVQKAGGVEVVVEAMRAHRRDPMVQTNGCNFVRAVACSKNKDIPDALIATDSVQCIVDLMQDEVHSTNADLMTGACAALWNIASIISMKEHMYDAGVIALLVETMGNHENSAAVQEHAIGCLWNFAFRERYRATISEDCDGVAAIAKAMETHRSVFPVQREAAGALFFLAGSKDVRVRKRLTSSNAIPQLFSLFREHYKDMFTGQLSKEKFRFIEQLSGALDRLGVMQNYVVNDDEYDPDDNADEYPIESPPFDIGDLLDMDLLSEDAPGWYREKGFTVDSEHSESNEEVGGKDFLRLPKEPEVGQEVCIRIVLPFGGRGYLYGTITNVASAPTDKDLFASSKIFGKGCPCPEPECPIRNGTREELVKACGAVNGQEVTAAVSLAAGSEYDDRKLRFKPLPEFFRGENSTYAMVIRFNERFGWKVVNIRDAANQDEGSILDDE